MKNRIEQVKRERSVMVFDQHTSIVRPDLGFCLVGLVGKKGVGKDATGNELAKLLEKLSGGWDFPLRSSFAKALYKEVSDKTGVPIEVLQDRKYKESFSNFLFHPPKGERLRYLKYAIGLKGKSPREELQWHGAEFRRAQDEYYWIRQLQEEIVINQRNRSIVITDVRFSNEVDLIKRLGGVVVRLEADCNKDPYENTEHGSRHISEIELDCVKLPTVVRTYGDIQHTAAEVLYTVHDELLKRHKKHLIDRN